MTRYDHYTDKFINDDLIGREEAIKELKESAKHHEENSREYQLMLRDRNIIRGLPTVPAIPISVIEQIKAEIKQEFDYVRVGCEVFEMGKAAGYRNAYNIIEKHIKEYME